MGKIAKNKFTKGLLRDISLDKFPQDAYVDLSNGRVLSTGTLSSGSIENSVGNSLFFSLPTTPNILKCTPVFGAGLNTTVTVLIFSNASTSVAKQVVIGNVSVEEASRLIVKAIKDQTTNPNILAFTDGTDIQISSNKSEGLSVIIQDSNGTPIYTVTTTTPSRSGTSLKIIGGKTIRDSIILYSTSNNGDGQIWIVNYDPSLITTSYKIVYNNDGANFSSDHPIGDEIIGLYETQRIQRAYWTDNNNPPRRLNTVDEDSYFLSPDELSNVASVKFTRPIINKITMDGILHTGVYQYGYVLKSSTTSLKTSVSPLSAVVNIVKANESTAVLWGVNSSDPSEYKGGPPGQPTSKSISGTIEDLGGDAFDMIDIVVFYRDNYQRTHTTANIFIRDLVIPDDGVVTFKHTGLESNEPFVVDANFFFNKVVTRVKTIATKKNVLLYGNIKLAGNENLKFNARAYRYKIDGSTYVDDTALDDTFSTWNKDAINPYNEFGHEDNNLFPNDAFKYKKGTSILGGTGPNVSYEFFVEMLDGDKYNSGDAGAAHDVGANKIPESYPWITKDRVTKTIDLGIDGEKYVNDNFFYDYKSPYVNLALRGYMPGEIYRFALLTYDKSGNPAFVNWIGDIKFPEISEMGVIGTNTGFSLINNGVHTIGTMGVRFNLSGIPANVRANMGGCRIVRVFRNDANVTRFGSGIMSVMRKAHITEFNNNIGDDTTSSDEFFCYSNDFHNYPTGTEIYGDTINLFPLISSWYALFFTGKDSSFTDLDVIYSFDSPVFQYEPGAVTFTGNEQIRVEGILGFPQVCGHTQTWLADANEAGSIYKYYSLYGLGNTTRYFNVSDFKTIGTLGSESPASIGMPAYNFVFNPANIDSDTVSASGAKSRVLYRASTSYGNYTALMNFSNSAGLYQYFRYGVPDIGEGGNDSFIRTRKILATYCRSLAKQYGGADENARDNNIYYGCSNFIPTEKIPAGSFTVFGGDVYTNICDSIKGERADLTTASTTADPRTAFPNSRLQQNVTGAATDPQNKKRLVSWFYPVISGYNIDLRTGTHFVNKTNGSSRYNNGGALFEDYWYSGTGYGTYSNWDTGFSFNPEPSVIEFEDEFDNMVMASEKKITGERFDNWSQFTGTNILVDGIYGPINKLSAFKDNIYFHQDKAFGRISVFPRAAVPNIGTDSSSIGLQEGSVLNDYAYISNVSGTRHQFSVIVSANALYWADVVSKKIMRFDEQQGTRALSDIYALKSYCADKMSGSLESTDDILNGVGIVSGFDYINNQYITTFLNGAKTDTIAFNETIDNFETRFSFTPNLYISDRRNMFTVKTNNSLYLHNYGNRGEFYGTKYPMDIELIFNPEPEVSKVLDVLQFTTEVYNSSGVDVPTDTLDYVRWSNDYQDSGILPLDSTNIKRRLRTWHIGTIRDTTKNTIRGHFAKLWFRYDNLSNNRIILHDMHSIYRSVSE